MMLALILYITLGMTYALTYPKRLHFAEFLAIMVWWPIAVFIVLVMLAFGEKPPQD